jgi:hypothetical protein
VDRHQHQRLPLLVPDTHNPDFPRQIPRVGVANQNEIVELTREQKMQSLNRARALMRLRSLTRRLFHAGAQKSVCMNPAGDNCHQARTALQTAKSTALLARRLSILRASGQGNCVR